MPNGDPICTSPGLRFQHRQRQVITVSSILTHDNGEKLLEVVLLGGCAVAFCGELPS